MKKLCLFGGKMFAVVWLDAEKCKPDCSFTSFWCAWWFTFVEESSPSENANLSVAFNHTMLDGKVQKRRRKRSLCSPRACFQFRHKPPSALLWAGALSLRNI